MYFCEQGTNKEYEATSLENKLKPLLSKQYLGEITKMISILSCQWDDVPLRPEDIVPMCPTCSEKFIWENVNKK